MAVYTPGACGVEYQSSPNIGITGAPKGQEVRNGVAGPAQPVLLMQRVSTGWGRCPVLRRDVTEPRAAAWGLPGSSCCGWGHGAYGVKTLLRVQIFSLSSSVQVVSAFLCDWDRSSLRCQKEGDCSFLCSINLRLDGCGRAALIPTHSAASLRSSEASKHLLGKCTNPFDFDCLLMCKCSTCLA